ncbi:MAG: tryptophan 7-halogenase [Planctomycetota bacterium]|nr:tryptophan 7-halogenase [Planctomycetota bacterium]
MNFTSQSSRSIDVAIVGGGPAGAALATLLERAGYHCAIFEAGVFPRYHIGESLIPHTFGILDRLGLLPKLRISPYPEKYSVRFVSPTGKESTPFYFSETIDGEGARTWQVERSSFDQLCLSHAREQGADVRMCAAVEQVLFDGARATGVRVRPSEGDAYDMAARVVVDASGRSTVLGEQLGLKSSVPGLRKASLWSYYKGGRRLDGIDAGETTIFMIRNRGWFWYIPLPDDVVSVGVVASPDELFSGTQEKETIYAREVYACGPLMDRLRTAKRCAGVYGGPRELAYFNRQTSGDGWVMVGDARAFLDPIYSSGLYLALASAELAADSIRQALEANDLSAAKLGAFEARLMAGVDVIRRLIHAFYDPHFSFGEFVTRFPAQRRALVDCLVGDVLKDMSAFTAALEQATPPPPSLAVASG